MKNKLKEFFVTNWAINNKTSVYVLVVFITILGIMNYIRIPKEQFPEIIMPTILVTTPYPGTSPEDMENLVTRPIEKQVKAMSGVKTVTSNSVQDFSSIVVEFNTDVDPAIAKQRVKDAVDKAKTNLPNNLPKEPDVMEIDFSEIPIMYINISGPYDLDKIKQYADIAQDKIEGLPEITRVDIIGSLEREIQINVDMFKMQAASLTFTDIERAVAAENVSVSAGNIPTFGMLRSIRIAGQFKSMEDIQNIVIKTSSGATIYIKDVADVVDGFKEQESFSRLNNQNVITLNIIKKSGKNLIEASDKIKKIIGDMKAKTLPSDLNVVITNDQSRFTKNTLEELNNTIIIGFLLVTIVLMFFMGFSNAFFVGLSVPLSMFIAYLIMPGLGFTMNMIVMFGFIFALGIIVDDAIVVIENTHRIHRTEPDITVAAKRAAGEVFQPILSGTLTTLAPFFPLAFWPGTIGSFMHYMPVTLILTLFASLFVAYIINPVFAVSFMKHEYDTDKSPRLANKKIMIIGAAMLFLASLFYVSGVNGLGNFVVFMFILFLLFQFFIRNWIFSFQNKIWPWVLNIYQRTLTYFLKKRRPYFLFGGIVFLFFFTFVLLGIKKPDVLFFPDNMPSNIMTLITMPVGTDQKVTDSITSIVEKRVMSVLGTKNPLVESVVTNVALGAGNGFFDRSVASNKGKVTINFIESKYRNGFNTNNYLDKIREAVKGIAGAKIVVEKNHMGPPTGKPINIEISSENLEYLILDADNFIDFLDSLHIDGVEELKSDFQNNLPEIIIDIDRIRANFEGITTGQIAMEIRNAVFGKEISKYKENEDEFPIQMRYSEALRKNIDVLMNMKITYRDMNSGILRQIPLASVAKIKYNDTYGGINRKNLKRMITISSEVLSGYTANAVVAKIKDVSTSFKKHEGTEINFTGEGEDQAETMDFLMKAMIIAIGLMFFILISQFNSLSKTLIILSEVIFSVIGVLLGIIIFDMSISVMMTGLGVVALGGIVVRNGILLVEFTDVLKSRGMKTRQAIIQAGRIRTTPVILTATATMLGLVPLAVGLNINFITMFTELNPQIHFGGDNVLFWGSLSWTIIFGLSFATFLTLVFVPAMYFIAYVMKVRISRNRSNRNYKKQQAIIGR